MRGGPCRRCASPDLGAPWLSCRGNGIARAGRCARPRSPAKLAVETAGGRRGGLMRPEADVHAYVQDLEKHLQLTLFGGGMADPEGAVLLVRGALADGDRDRAAALARQTQRLATITPGNPDMTAAADHARGLIDQDPAALQRAAGATRPRGPGPARWRTPGTPGPGRAIRAGPRPCSARPTPCTRSSATPTTWPGSGPACGPRAPGSATGPTRTARPSAGTA